MSRCLGKGGGAVCAESIHLKGDRWHAVHREVRLFVRYRLQLVALLASYRFSRSPAPRRWSPLRSLALTHLPFVRSSRLIGVKRLSSSRGPSPHQLLSMLGVPIHSSWRRFAARLVLCNWSVSVKKLLTSALAAISCVCLL